MGRCRLGQRSNKVLSMGWTIELKWDRVHSGQVPPALLDAVCGPPSNILVTAFVTPLDLRLGRSAFPEFFAAG
jgi:hypothetical protein